VLGTRFWQDLPWPAFRDLPANTIAVQPVAAIEQHGPHLPVAVDRLIGEGVVAATLAKLPADTPVLVLPMQAVGLSVEHLHYPGTLTTSPETLLALLTDIGASVARAGVRRLVFLNSHGGNVPVLETAARRLRIDHDMLVLTTAWARMAKPAALRDPVEGVWGIHAGREETSLMLTLASELVRMDRARDFASRWQALANAAPALHPQAGAPFGWLAEDLQPAGAVGDAQGATAERGAALLDNAATQLSLMLQTLAAFDLDTWLTEEPSPHV